MSEGPLCPVCCLPSRVDPRGEKVWRCHTPGCVIATFTPLDEFGAAPLSFNINGREVLSETGVRALVKEAFPVGIAAMLRALPMPDLSSEVIDG